MDLASPYVGAVTGLLSLIDRAFLLARTFREVKQFPETMAELIYQFANESEKINIWYREAVVQKHLQDIGAGHTVAIQDAELNDRLCKRMAWITEGIDKSLKDAEKVIGRYLDRPTSQPPRNGDAAAGGGDLGALVVIARQNPHNLTAGYRRVLRDRMEALLRTRVKGKEKLLAVAKPWDEPDVQKLRQILQNLKYWTGELRALLPPRAVAAQSSEASVSLLEDADEEDPNVFQIIESAAEEGDPETAASAGLAIRVLHSHSETERASREADRRYAVAFHRLSIMSGSRGLLAVDVVAAHPTADGPSGRKIDVHIDWLDYKELSSDQREIASGRINSLCDLLGSKKPDKLVTLQPRGYVSDPTRERFGILSEYPPHTRAIVSLRDLLGTQTRYPRMALGQRFSLARKICTAFLELHKARWLHKGFSSLSVLISSPQNASEEEEEDKKTLEFLAISGFQYARPAGNAQVSLPIQPDVQDDLMLYHHPEVRGNIGAEARPGNAYKKYLARHDIYSLGVVLFEIGVWKPIADFPRLRESRQPAEFSSSLRKLARANLHHSMGQRYADVVLHCLDCPEEPDSMEGKYQLKSMLYEIVEPMQSCHCRSD